MPYTSSGCGSRTSNSRPSLSAGGATALLRGYRSSSPATSHRTLLLSGTAPLAEVGMAARATSMRGSESVVSNQPPARLSRRLGVVDGAALEAAVFGYSDVIL